MNDGEPIRELKAACALVLAGEQRGTAYLVRGDALLTCFHVVQALAEGDRVLVQFLHARREARVRHLDAALDCSLLLLDSHVDVKPLRLASQPPERGMAGVSFGFPLVTGESGMLIDVAIKDDDALDLLKRPALSLHSADITPNAELEGFSGSPVIAGGYVIGQLAQVVLDTQGKPQYGKVYAIPAVALAKLLPPDAGERRTLLRQPPPTPYCRVAYIERPVEESRALAVLEDPGKAVALRAPSRVGTTWLLERLAERLAPQGELALIDLKMCIGNPQITTLSDFLRELICQIIERLTEPLGLPELGPIVSEFWRSDLTANLNATTFMSKVILPRLLQKQRLLILALDGVEQLDRLAYRDQILAMLRLWVQRGTQKDTWSPLRVILSLSTVTSLSASNIYQSPFFTVAQLISVADFNDRQVAQLARLYGISWEAKDQSQVCAVIGGNAYLVHLLFHECRMTGEAIQTLMSPQYGLFTEYLRLCKERLNRAPDLYAAFTQALQSPKTPIDLQSYDRLSEAGLLEKTKDGYRPRYGLHWRLL